jgi:hypothetical protein
MHESLLIHFDKEEVVLALEEYYKKQYPNKIIDFKLDNQAQVDHYLKQGITLKAIYVNDEIQGIKEIDADSNKLTTSTFQGFLTSSPSWVTTTTNISATGTSIDTSTNI